MALSSFVTVIAELVKRGALVPVEVFGTDECCLPEHEGTDCESKGFGLCDRFSTHAWSGSDCNRAEFFLLRPADEVMDDPTVRAAIEAVLD